jgi:hypothetical protein
MVIDNPKKFAVAQPERFFIAFEKPLTSVPPTLQQRKLPSTQLSLTPSGHPLVPGMDKMIKDSKGEAIITDSATVFKQMEVIHPAAKMIRTMHWSFFPSFKTLRQVTTLFLP